ncbi:MAG: APC family permease [Gemmatimonadales bacterium]
MTNPAQPSQPEFVKAISRLDATALVVGSMIGSGIFIVSADILRQVQAPGLLLLAWGLSGAITLLGALSYGELAAMFPKAGGQYVYLREGISPLFGYLYGWTLFTVIQTGTIAAVAVAFARFTAVFVPALSPDVFLGGTVSFPRPIGDIAVGLSPQRILAILSVVALTWINVRGVKTAAAIQTSLTIIKTAALAGLILLGITIGRDAEALTRNFGPSFWPAGGLTLAMLPVVGAAMVGSLFSMDAWNNVGFASGEFQRPEKDLPFAMVVGVLTVTLLYVVANTAYLTVLPASQIANAPQDRVGTAALQAMFGDAGLYIMAAAIMVSTFGCNNGLILSGARVYYAMARDNLFFRSTGALHPRYKTPAVALAVQAIWTCALCLSGTYSELLKFVIFAAVLFYMITGVGLFALRWRRPAAERPVRAPGYPWLPALYIVATGLVCANLLLQEATAAYSGLGFLIVLLGVPVYFGWRAMVRKVESRRREA